jgi:hypothetical protein
MRFLCSGLHRFDRTLVQIQSRVRPSPRIGHTLRVASVEHEETQNQVHVKAYLIGGEVSETDLVEDSAFELDITFPTAVALASSPSSISIESAYSLSMVKLQLFEGPSERFSAAMAIRDGQLYFFGGEAPGMFFSDTLYSDLYIIALRDFVQRRPAWRLVKTSRNAPSPRSAHTFTPVDAAGGLVVFGGLTSEGWTPVRPTNYVHVLVTDSMQWKTLDVSASDSIPMKRAHHAAVAIRQSTQLFVFGGGDGVKNGELFDDTWILDFATSKWIETFPDGAAPEERSGHSMIYDEITNSVIVFGGQGKSSSFNDVYILTNVGLRSLTLPYIIYFSFLY